MNTDSSISTNLKNYMVKSTYTSPLGPIRTCEFHNGMEFTKSERNVI